MPSTANGRELEWLEGFDFPEHALGKARTNQGTSGRGCERKPGIPQRSLALATSSAADVTPGVEDLNFIETGSSKPSRAGSADWRFRHASTAGINSRKSPLVGAGQAVPSDSPRSFLRRLVFCASTALPALALVQFAYRLLGADLIRSPGPFGARSTLFAILILLLASTFAQASYWWWRDRVR